MHIDEETMNQNVNTWNGRNESYCYYDYYQNVHLQH